MSAFMCWKSILSKNLGYFLDPAIFNPAVGSKTMGESQEE
jgi:hypothetical protein